MRLVHLLGALLVLSLVLLATVVVTDVERGWLAAAGDGTVANVPPRTATSPPDAGAQDVRRCLDEAELRRVIREELAAQPAPMAVARHAEGPGGVVTPPAPPVPARQRELVERQLDDYIRAGAISEAQMAELQSQIARLDPPARREVLAKIVRAMNSGALAGNL